MNMLRWLSPMLIAALPLGALAQPQCQWVERRSPGPLQFRAAAAYSPVNGAVISQWGSQTWAWNGDHWRRIVTPGPWSRSRHGMVFDGGLQEIVVFGGQGGSSTSFYGDTWAFDGSAWRDLGVAGPSPRARFGMAYDTARQRAVLYGGTGIIGHQPQYSDETWEWDGQGWHLRTPTARPPLRAQTAMAYDSIRGRTVLFGGSGVAAGMPYHGDTWEWDGTTWLLRHAGGAGSGAPSPRGAHRLVFDAQRGRTVLFGGSDGGPLGDLWEWDGGVWHQRHSPGAPAGPEARSDHTMAYHAPTGRTIVSGGFTSPSGGTPFYDTWSWDGQQWRFETGPGPSTGITSVLVYDAAQREPLRMGFDTQLWGWDGDRWRPRSPSVQVDNEHYAGAYDSTRQEVVVFGWWGLEARTSVWDGQTWTMHVHPPGSEAPTRRVYHAMGHDPVRGRTVLFGGRDAGPPWANYNDTWEWDGASWTRVQGAGGPALAWGHRLAWDSSQNRMLMVMAGEVWSYDGATWSLRAAGGSATVNPAVAFDPERRRLLVFGGLEWPETSDELWALDGNGWSQLAIAGPRGREFTHMAWDERRRRMVLFGGTADIGQHLPQDDTWELICEPVCYANCDGSSTHPALNIDDFTCFINEYAAGVSLTPVQQRTHYANCDGSTIGPVINVDDFSCFINLFAAGCP
jgi:hypothetical protein